MAQYLDKTGLTTLWAKIKNTFALKSHTHSKSEVGLGNVNNTSDADKPVSNATQQALNLKANANDVYTKSETDNKINEPLYNLGYYDTISGNVITRQTGYLDGKDYLSKTISKNGVNNPYIKIDNIHVDYIENIIGNCNRVDTNSWWNFTFSNVTISYDSTYKFLVIMLPNGSTNTSSLNNIYIQYKLATSYTEEIIEGQPLITLDQQGSQWLRNEWEKGLNLLDYGSRIVNKAINSSGQIIDYTGAYYIKVNLKPNTTYNASGCTDALSGSVSLFTSDGTFIRKIENSNLDSKGNFITDSNVSYALCDNLADRTQPMLVEGDHPYPYQPYEGKTIHEKDITDLYENAYNLGYYDTMVENSDGTYTITRQTGYIVLDGVKNKFDGKFNNTNNEEYYYEGCINYISKPLNTGTIVDIISNTLKTVSADELYIQNTYGIAADTSGKIIIGLTTAITTIDEANAWLAQNPTSIQYKLATATTERVEKNHYATYNQRFIL